MLTPLNFLSKKGQKVQKLDEIFIFSERHEEFQWNFSRDVSYDNMKSHKKEGLHPLYKKYIFGRTTLGRSNGPQAFLGLDFVSKIPFLSKYWS